MSTLIDAGQPTLLITSRGQHNYENQVLHKIGQVSGWTYGKVETTCSDWLTESGWVKECSDRVDFSMHEGDSGSPVFRVRYNGTVELRGIAFGWVPGYEDALISDLHQIELDLGQLKVHEPMIHASIEGPSSVPANAFCEWYGYAEGVPPFQFAWHQDGMLVGTSQYYSVSSTGTSDFQLSFTVTDSRSHTATDATTISIDPNNNGIICE